MNDNEIVKTQKWLANDTEFNFASKTLIDAAEMIESRDALKILSRAVDDAQKVIASKNAEIERLKQKSEVDTSDTLTPNAKWIYARHMLPGDDAGEVLAIVHGNPLANITLDGAYQLATHYPGDGWVVEEFPEWDEPIVTHWMPLPEPPQAGKEVRV